VAAVTPTDLGLVLHVALCVAVVIRVLLRPHREPASRIAWIVVVFALPLLGVGAYILLGEVNIGRRRVARMRAVVAALPLPPGTVPGTEDPAQGLPERYANLFRTAASIAGFGPLGGNTGQLLPDSNAVIDAMVADIDAAVDHVHLLFYIWLADNNGLKIAGALQRAAARGVTCRAMADGLGSRDFIGSRHWRALREAGVKVAIALPVGNVLLRPLVGRIDLRNHRKIVVIDGRVTYCGSQNCADPEFRVKARYAPWVDAVARFEGPVVRQNQYLFAGDWMAFVREDLGELLRAQVPAPAGDCIAQVVGTGPTGRFSAMPELFEALMHAARERLFITTPYFVPDESILSALCAAAWRGVQTDIIFPARNDSLVVAAASRSYYPALLQAGVRIHEYAGGLLHTKSVTLDGEVSLIGSANMDRRSFELNYENNILLLDRGLTAQLQARQHAYLERSRRIRPQEVASWSLPRRLWHNGVAMLGPIL